MPAIGVKDAMTQSLSVDSRRMRTVISGVAGKAEEGAIAELW